MTNIENDTLYPGITDFPPAPNPFPLPGRLYAPPPPKKKMVSKYYVNAMHQNQCYTQYMMSHFKLIK